MEEQNGRRVIRHSEPVVSKDTTEIEPVFSKDTTEIDSAARKKLIKKWIKRGIKILIIILIFLYLRNTYKLLNQYNNFYFSSLKGFPTSDVNFNCGIDLDADNAVDYKGTHLEYIGSEHFDYGLSGNIVVFNYKFTNNGNKPVAFNQIYSVVCLDYKNIMAKSSYGQSELGIIAKVFGLSVVGDVSKSTNYRGQTNVQYDVPVGETVDVHVCFDASEIDYSDDVGGAIALVKPKYYYALFLDGSWTNQVKSTIEELGTGLPE